MGNYALGGQEAGSQKYTGACDDVAIVTEL